MGSNVYPWDCFREPAELDPHLCFVMSPFREEFAGVRVAIAEIGAALGYRCIRADDIEKPGIIHADIWKHIHRAGVVVADITDLNPNVLVEVGVASAIKESFRLIIIIRQDSTKATPFDLAPFRHIRYDNSLVGSKQLRDQLRSALEYAKSDAGLITSLQAKMDEWERSECSFALLASAESLARARALSTIAATSEAVRGYCLASSIQHSVDSHFWINTNTNNPFAAECMVAMLFSPWAAPRLRAAYALQHFQKDVRERAVKAARLSDREADIKDLLDAIENESIEALVRSNPNNLLPSHVQIEVLHAFAEGRRTRVRFS